MSYLLSGSILFVDDDELMSCIELFSDRIRRDTVLRPTLDRLVGNRWGDAERQVYILFHTTLFGDDCPNIDANWLATVARVLSSEEVDRLSDILLACIFETFPLHSAGKLSDIATELASTLKFIISARGLERQRRLLKTHARLNAGALLSSF